VPDQHGRDTLAPLTRTGLEIGLGILTGALTIDSGLILETEANVDAGNLADGTEGVARFLEAGIGFGDDRGERGTLDGVDRVDQGGLIDCFHAFIIPPQSGEANGFRILLLEIRTSCAALYGHGGKPACLYYLRFCPWP